MPAPLPGEVGEMSARRVLFIVLMTVFPVSCRSQRPKDAKLLRQFATNGCNSRLNVLRRGPDQVSVSAACALATTALLFVGRGGAREVGVQPSDTGKLELAVVSTFDIPYPRGEPTRHEWVVSFALPSRTQSLAITIDRVSGALDAKLAEPVSLRP